MGHRHRAGQRHRRVVAADAVEPLIEQATVDAYDETERERMGMPIDGFDAQIAAICRSHGAALATRNVKDFHATGIKVIDPWHAD